MTVAAFHLGLKDKIDELEELINSDTTLYHKGYTAGELRKLLIQKDIPSFIDRDQLCMLTKNILDVSKAGLEERHLGEEVFLKPLYERVQKRTNPGKQIIQEIEENNTLEKLIEEYGRIEN